MENDSLVEDVLWDLCVVFIIISLGVGVICFFTNKPIGLLIIGAVMCGGGLVCGLLSSVISMNRPVSVPLPLTTDSSSRERFTVEISPETTKALKELEKWLGGKEDEGTVLASALALLMTVKECVEAGGTLCFRDKDGVVQDVNLKYSGKK